MWRQEARYAMKVRSITLFAPDLPHLARDLRPYGQFAGTVRAALERAGLGVQTVRLATPPWPDLGPEPEGLIQQAIALDHLAPSEGIEYISLGPVLAGRHDAAALVPRCHDLLAATTRSFCTAAIATPAHGIDLAALRAAADVVAANVALEAGGFANLRFAALAAVPPHGPYFPAAYARRGTTPGPNGVALALQSGDLATRAVAGAATLQEAHDRLVAILEEAAARVEAVLEPLCDEADVPFFGLDFSLAPFPDQETSSAAAIERLGAAPFGAPGTLAGAAMLTEAMQSASFRHCGFNGLMLPVLEDAVLAARSGAGSYDLNSLLLFSAVCGTGLDTVPLPGETDPPTLAAILLDVAALALRLQKPLTARLMPIPGLGAGDRTDFDFPFFANGAVLPLHGRAAPGLTAGSHLRLTPFDRQEGEGLRRGATPPDPLA